MYTRITTSTDDLFAYKITGKITTAEYKQIKSSLEKGIKKFGKIRILVEIDHLDVPEPGVLWEDLKFTAEYIHNIERLAVVGHPKWERWWINLLGSMIPADAKFFDETRKYLAWHWVQEKQVELATG